MQNIVYLMDCVQGMKKYPDKYFDLAIVDPPYGGVKKGGYTKNQGGIGGLAKKRTEYNLALWEQSAPEQEYFDELFRVSKNQIIWGANYYISKIKKDSQGWVVWDKKHPDGVRFADAELAWTSFDRATRIFRYMWNGLIKEKGYADGKRIHPTQKPTALYKWLLEQYAKRGQKILDTHVGSGSSRIACFCYGCEFVGFEIVEQYFNDQEKRFEEEKRNGIQQSLFDLVEEDDESTSTINKPAEKTSAGLLPRNKHD